MNWLLFAIKNTFRNRRRAAITIMIATIGVASVMISGGFALFTYDSLREMATRDTGHLILAQQGHFEREEETPMELGLADYGPIQEQLKGDRRIRSVLPRVQFSGLVSNGEKSSIFVGTGVEPDEFTVKGPFLSLQAGRRLGRSGDGGSGLYQVMVASELARNMGVEVGGGLTLLATTSEGSLNALDVEVVGIFSTGVPEMDKRLLYVHTATAQELLLSDRVSTLSVYLYDTEKTAELNAELGRRFSQLDRQTWRDQAVFYKKVRDLYNRIFGTLGIVIVIMVFFSVSNTMSMVVVERTREIGTLAAMGTYGWEIIRNFVLEALVIALAGGTLGLLLTGMVVIGLQFADIQMPPPPGRSNGYPLVVYFSVELATITVPTMIAVCVAAAWHAAHRGARKPVVEALAHV